MTRWSGAPALLPAPLRGRHAELALEGAVESGLGLVAEPLGDVRQPRAGRAKLAGGEREAPFGQVLDRRLPDEVREALGEDRAGAADLARELVDRPGARGVAVQKLEAFADIGVAQAGEPAALLGRQRLDVAAQRLDEEHLREPGQDHVRACARRGDFGHRVAQRALEPVARGAGAHVDLEHRRQRREYRAAELRVAGEEAANEAGLRAVAAVLHARHLAARRRADDIRDRAWGEPQIAAQDVVVAVREHHHVACRDRRLGAAVLGTDAARAFRDVVVVDEMAGVGHQQATEPAARDDAPRLAELRIQKRRAVQLHLPQHFRQRLDEPFLLGGGVADKRCGRPARTRSAASATIRHRPRTEEIMADKVTELVVLMTKGADHELSSVGFTIANGGMTAGLKVSVFLTSASVDLVRKRAADLPHVPPLEPLKGLIDDFLRRGGTLWACTPCVKARGYTQEDLVEGVVISGASAMHERIKAGAATLSF